MRMSVKNEKAYIREIKSGLSECILEYIIYIDSGYDSHRSLLMLSKRIGKGTLTKEFQRAINMIQNGVSFHKAIMSISEKCYMANLDSFIRIISRGYIRGEEGTIGNLRILIERILHEEISDVKERAEQASTKLSLPIMIVFIAIVIISVYPALMQFKI